MAVGNAINSLRLGKPVLVTRDVTERPQAVAAGTVRLIGPDVSTVVDGVAELWEDERAHEQMDRAVNPYGDGRAATRILRALLDEPVEEFSAVTNVCSVLA